MTALDQEFLAGLLSNAAEVFIARLKDEGLVHDDRPLLSLEQTSERLGLSIRVVRDLTRGKDGQPPVLATVKVIPDGHKGIMVEPRTIDAYLEERRRVSWIMASREES